MKPVQDDTGKRYVLLKRSEHASLVRDPETGNECYVQNDRLEHLEDESVLETAARTIDEPVRTLLTAVHDETALGLLVDLGERGPLGVREMLDAYDCCESDLHGRLTVLTAADLIAETDVAGERGYRLADEGEVALEAIGANTDANPRRSGDDRGER
ncbi:DUF7346 family protein [Natronococcus jeotgali]|uniref:HTH domain protein n=1 Tax=Natronococcus jeotgali DSM 18795 TaxID=1227498 RepID=L9WRG1_9EURY|nr:hypothetical protein [Natronococcus jeotgali]ELY52069.1 hypothetical protein C492_20116 [Natronococcus jeotgali DSM 18795]